MMQATVTKLSEEQAEKVAQMVKMLLLNPEMLSNAADDPHAALKAAGLNDAEITTLVDYLEDMSQHLRMEMLPWLS